MARLVSQGVVIVIEQPGSIFLSVSIDVLVLLPPVSVHLLCVTFVATWGDGVQFPREQTVKDGSYPRSSVTPFG